MLNDKWAYNLRSRLTDDDFGSTSAATEGQMEWGCYFYKIWHWLPVPRDTVHLSWTDCDGSRVSTICVIRALRRLPHQMEEGYRGVSENHRFMAKSYAATSHVLFLGYCYSIVLNGVKDDKNLCTTVLETFDARITLLEVPALGGPLGA